MAKPLSQRFEELRPIIEMTSLLLDASALPYMKSLQQLVERCFWAVQSCPTYTHYRTQWVSLHRWVALCATVEGATTQQMERLVDLVEYELGNPDGPNSAPVQNWYLTKSIGKMTPLRRQICAATPKRSVVSLSGARATKPKRLQASIEESSGPGSSPPRGGTCIPFPGGLP